MVKNLVLVFLMALIALPMAFANIDILQSTISLSGNPGQIVTGNITIYNPDAAKTISFSGYQLVSGSNSFNITPISQITIGANATSVVSFTATIPSNQKAGLYTGALVATANTTDSDSVAIQFTVNPVPNLSISQNNVVGVKGYSATLNITFQNTGNTDYDMAYSITSFSNGIDTITIPSAAGTMHLNSQQSSTITRSITIPQNVTTGLYHATLTATYGSTQKNFTLNMTVENEVRSFTLNPSSINFTLLTTGATSEKVLYVTNTGNIPLEVTFSTTGMVHSTNTSNIIVPTLSASSLNLGVGETKNITLTASALNYPIGTYNGVLNATSENFTRTATLQATVNNPISSISLPDVVFPSSDLNTSVNTTFVVKNTGDTILNNLQISSNAASEWNISFTGLPSTLNPGENATVRVSGFIPAGKSTGTYKIGEIFVTSDKANATSKLSVSIKSKLLVTMKAKVGSSSYVTFSDGDTISKDAYPDYSVDFKINVKNNFPSSNDLTIEDITVTVTIKDIDDGSDLEEESESFDLDQGDDQDVTLSFKIPTEVKKGKYTVDILVEGEDEEGNLHKFQAKAYLNVRKETHSLKIANADITPSSIECGNTANLYVKIINIGERDEKDAKVTIVNPAMGVNIAEMFEVSSDVYDEDSIYEKTFTINVPGNFAAGTYNLLIRAYYDTNNLKDEKQVSLLVTCQQSSGTTDTTGTTSGTSNESGTGGGTLKYPVYNYTTPEVSSIEYDYRESKTYFWILVVLNVLLVIGIIYLIYRLIVG